MIVGASVGAINGAYLAATLPDGGDPDALRRSRDLGGHQWGDVLATPSLRDLDGSPARALTFTGLLSLDIPSLLDTTPLEPRWSGDPVRADRRARRRRAA